MESVDFGVRGMDTRIGLWPQLLEGHDFRVTFVICSCFLFFRFLCCMSVHYFGGHYEELLSCAYGFFSGIVSMGRKNETFVLMLCPNSAIVKSSTCPVSSPFVLATRVELIKTRILSFYQSDPSCPRPSQRLPYTPSQPHHPRQSS